MQTGHTGACTCALPLTGEMAQNLGLFFPLPWKTGVLIRLSACFDTTLLSFAWAGNSSFVGSVGYKYPLLVGALSSPSVYGVF